jgi:hypothetical protein
MYHKMVGTGVGLGAALPTTGIGVLYGLLTAFVLISTGFAVLRLLPKLGRRSL